MTTVTLVAAKPPDGIGTQLWAVAVPAEQAVDTVLKSLPRGWSAEVADHQLDAGQITTLGLEPGQAVEFSSGMKAGRK